MSLSSSYVDHKIASYLKKLGKKEENEDIFRKRIMIVLRGISKEYKIEEDWEVNFFDEIRLLTKNKYYNEKIHMPPTSNRKIMNLEQDLSVNINERNF